MTFPNPVGALDRLESAGGPVSFYRLDRVLDAAQIERLPFVVRVFTENVLRHLGAGAERLHLDALARWPGDEPVEFPFLPARVVLQDFTGVPVVADLAAIRSAVKRLGGDVSRVNPLVPVDLVIDHSVIVDFFGSADALERKVGIEYDRNHERYAFLRWAQQSFSRMRVVPPGAGIVHQVNLEFLARVVMTDERDGERIAYPDTLVGTDSHTTMIGGLGVLGWGVGGIEAEAAMLGEPVTMLTPAVVGVRLDGAMPEGATATDLVLTLTQQLRSYGVVGKFVEFYGPGLSSLTVADRATIANMSPEYGATEGFFPVDEQTLSYLRATGRDESLIDLVERYCKQQHLWHGHDAAPVFHEKLELDLATVVPSMAGPKRPQDRVALPEVANAFRKEVSTLRGNDELRSVATASDTTVGDGSVVIAAITSCTNTSNPAVMIAAGLVARNAVARGMKVSSAVKTSLAPGSPVVIDYLERANLLSSLEQIGFYTVGFGCTTCIGNSGPLPDEVARAVEENSLAVAAVLSGNRNFEGRVHPQVRLAFLASPPLVVAYALAGTVNIDLAREPLGKDTGGNPVYLKDLWPSNAEVLETVNTSANPESYRSRTTSLFEGGERWKSLPVPQGDLYEWDPASTYITEPPFVAQVTDTPPAIKDIHRARVLVFVGDSITTDHISPAGSIAKTSPAADWLRAHGVPDAKLHSYGARRGHHDVMVRGTFANIRLRNLLVPGSEGGVTAHLPDGETMPIFEAAERYRAEGVPLVILAGKEYGSGSSRDWAAKGTVLLGARAVIAESFERIHRSNLAQMGVLPLEFASGETAATLDLTGRELFDIIGLESLKPGQTLRVAATREDGTVAEFDTRCRLDTPTEVRYYREGGILPSVVRELASKTKAAKS
ncbi:MAG: aconitate hydratase AcnA [Actinomycetota bacterium]